MVQGSIHDPSSPEGLLFSLCCKLLGKEKSSKATEEVSDCFQYALRVIGSRLVPSVASDEFQVVERIKRKLVRGNRETDAAVFAELYRKFAAQPVLQSKWAILYLLLSISESNKRVKSTSQVTGLTPFFGRGLPTYATSTPANPGLARPASRPSGISTLHSSGSSSGVSSGISIPSITGTTDPTPTPSSFAPNYGATPSVRFADEVTVQQSDGSRLATLVAQSMTISRGGTQDVNSKSVVRFQSYGNDSQNTTYEVTEAALLRDIIFVFQGIEGKYIKYEQSSDSYRIDNKLGVPKSVRDFINKLAELGWLYRKVRKYLDARAGDKALGLVGQSFCAALQRELTEYYRLMAVLEGQQQIGDQGIVGEGASGTLTLRRLVVWTYDPLIRLRTLAALVDTCKGKKGGALLSAIHSYTQHGDPFVKSLVKHMLNQVSSPVRAILDRWIYEGELEDGYQEFFIAVDYTVRDDRLWYEKYSLRKAMVPSFISLELATKILNIGKSINFIRQVCQDNSPILRDEGRIMARLSTDEKAAPELTTGEEFWGSALQESIDVAYKETSKRLLEILVQKYKFFDHLRVSAIQPQQALRLYMLLGQGDFIRHLMDLLESDLARPASTLYMHNLTGVLEAAIRATNAQYEDPDILQRVDCRLLEVSPGDTGWDVFSLDYHVDGPISTVFTPECMIHYLRIFNFLWRAKRMEYCLSGIWKEQMTSHKLLKGMPEVLPILHQCHMLASEMIQFIHQTQYYITFEVLECCWAELKKKVTEASDLDHIIAAHETFLDQVLSRSLLDTESRNMLTQLRAIFDLIIQFHGAQLDFFNAATEEAEMRQKMNRKIGKKTEEGDWGLTEKDEEEEKKRSVNFLEFVIPNTRAQLRVLAQSYQDMVQQFLVMLTTHQDVNLRFLSFRLDFNEHYKKKDPKIRSPLTHRFSKRYKKGRNSSSSSSTPSQQGGESNQSQ